MDLFSLKDSSYIGNAVDKIHVIDKAFPDWLEAHIEQACSTMPWSWIEIDAMHDAGKEYALSNLTFDIASNVVNDHQNVTRLLNDVLTLDVIPKAIPSAQIHRLGRVRFNGTLRGFDLNPHFDYVDSTAWVLVYYVNDSDGDTVFYDKDHATEIFRCKYKKGRAVLFPADIYHKAEAPKDTPLRISIGVHYVMSV